MSAAETLDQPAVVDDMPEPEYHAHPALSSSGARKLLPPSCPAIFKHEREHGSQEKKEYDFGSAAHKLLLGKGAEIRVVDAENWRTKAAQQERKDARTAGEIPLLPHEHAQAVEMVEKVRTHPVAGALFADGVAELSLFWRDGRSGVNCRARIDWFTADLGDLVDYKTTNSVDPHAIAKSIATYGYHQQGDWYCDGAEAVGLTAARPEFVLVFQSKAPPYLVTVVELDSEAKRVGAARNRRARSIFAECEATGVWPTHADDVVRLGLPGWATRDEPEEPPETEEPF